MASLVFWVYTENTAGQPVRVSAQCLQVRRTHNTHLATHHSAQDVGRGYGSSEWVGSEASTTPPLGQWTQVTFRLADFALPDQSVQLNGFWISSYDSGTMFIDGLTVALATADGRTVQALLASAGRRRQEAGGADLVAALAQVTAQLPSRFAVQTLADGTSHITVAGGQAGGQSALEVTDALLTASDAQWADAGVAVTSIKCAFTTRTRRCTLSNTSC